MSRFGPGLDLSHGFVHLIRRHQLTHAEELREAEQQTQAAAIQRASAVGKKEKKPAKKPAVALYRRGCQLPTVSCRKLQDLNTACPLSFLSTDARAMSGDEDMLRLADIAGYAQPYQSLIHTAITDLRSIRAAVLSTAAECIVSRAYMDEGYQSTAAKLCAYLIQTEYEWQQIMAIPSYVFRQSMVTHCKELVTHWEQLTGIEPLHGRRFVHFVQLAYEEIRPGGYRDVRLTKVLAGIMDELIRDVAAGNTEELSVLSGIFHESGHDVEQEDADHMTRIVNSLRDILLYPQTQAAVRKTVLQMIELHASKWKFSQGAKQFYFRTQ